MGPATFHVPGALSMKVEYLLWLNHSHTQTSYTGTRDLIRGRAGVALYKRLFARFMATRRRGVGSLFLPWGKGLTF